MRPDQGHCFRGKRNGDAYILWMQILGADASCQIADRGEENFRTERFGSGGCVERVAYTEQLLGKGDSCAINRLVICHFFCENLIRVTSPFRRSWTMRITTSYPSDTVGFR